MGKDGAYVLTKDGKEERSVGDDGDSDVEAEASMMACGGAKACDM